MYIIYIMNRYIHHTQLCCCREKGNQPGSDSCGRGHRLFFYSALKLIADPDRRHRFGAGRFASASKVSRSPSATFYPFSFGGGVFLKVRLQKKGTLIPASLLEDLGVIWV